MPLALITFGLMVFASHVMLALFGSDPVEAGGLPFHSETAQLAALLSSPIMNVLAVISIFAGGLLYFFGGAPLFGSDPVDAGAADAHTDETTRPAKRPALSPIARAASDRVNAALGRLRSMPAETFSPEARLEYDAIRDKHLPSLRDAHAKARAAYPASTPQATTIDGELAGSLDLIAGKLDELIEDCGDEARTGFDVERRFVELRHPSTSDPLALPAVHMVERATSQDEPTPSTPIVR